jgi:hypothetical protein
LYKSGLNKSRLDHSLALPLWWINGGWKNNPLGGAVHEINVICASTLDSDGRGPPVTGSVIIIGHDEEYNGLEKVLLLLLLLLLLLVLVLVLLLLLLWRLCLLVQLFFRRG